MIPNVSEALQWLEKHKTVLKGILRGVERETLRITPEGGLSNALFPPAVGSALTHRWITTDFAESMFEFVTPVNTSIDQTLDFLHDLHRYALKKVDDELFWPLSMPCSVATEDEIMLAKYGSSNQGKVKEVYREGLKLRYGAMMQIISGVHYNFSLPLEFWRLRYGVEDEISGKDKISAGYFNLIRNYFRFGWLIPFLFGASPSICPAFIKDKEKLAQFKRLAKGDCYLPYATSLRIGDLGYTSDAQKNLKITFNDVPTYVETIKNATQTRSEYYHQLGVVKDGKYQQLNDNILQIENEFYAYIRPKRVVEEGDGTMMNALLKRGVQYIEVRALDVNPFSPVGITKEQMHFLDLFLVWCALVESPEMKHEELHCALSNWHLVVNEGRKPNLELTFGCNESRSSLAAAGKTLFNDLLRVADVLDSENTDCAYRASAEKLMHCFDDPEQTLSGRIAKETQEMGMSEYAMSLAKQYKQLLTAEPLRILTEEDFANEQARSLQKQQQTEQQDTMSFEQYIKKNIN